MKLLTQELINTLPGPRAQENVEDPIVYAKFFHPLSGWVWYVTEAWNAIVDANGDFVEERKLSEPLKDGEKIEYVMFFGFVVGVESEFGNFSLNELQSIQKPLPIERDLHFKPTKLSILEPT